MRYPRFLIVDADPETRRFLGGLLTDLGGKTDQPGNPAQTRELLDKGQYDCVLMDREIPPEWREVVDSAPAVGRAPLVFLTGPGGSEPPPAAVISAADGYLPRRHDSAQLLAEHVRRAIERLAVPSTGTRLPVVTKKVAAGPISRREERFADSKIIVHTRRISAPGPAEDIVSVCDKGNDRYAILLGDYTGSCGLEEITNLRLRARVEMHLAENPGPGGALGDLNTELIQAGQAIDYMTAVAVLVDLRRKRLVHAVAGHQPPLHRRWSGVTWRPLPGRGIPLGIRGGESYVEHVRPLAPGDKILLLSDGIFKMRGGQGGFRRVETALEGIDLLPSDAAPNEVLEGISDMVASATGGAALADEITATLIQV